ncbi:MAG: type I-E CRISPR-associated protein Cas5/CasD [Polyangiales bacterium]
MSVDVLRLRLSAPLMSFGGPLTDSLGRTEEFPQRSMLVGMIGNALGLDHREGGRLQRLQSRVRYAARQDRPGTQLVDYQTVDLSQESMVGTGWTTEHTLEVRGGASGEGTHIRYRHYLADASYAVALTLAPAAEEPTLDDVERALRAPERPLFIGRKCCIPATPIVIDRVVAATLYDALVSCPRERKGDQTVRAKMWWSETDAPAAVSARAREVEVHDARDWVNQIHAGRRYMREGEVVFEKGAP